VKKLSSLKGKDVIKGRPIRLNRVTLEPISEKPYAELLFFGDLHFGHPTCDIERAKSNLDYCLKNKVYVLVMGDLIEAGIKSSVGDSLYMQKLNPQKQYEYVQELLRPLAEAGLIIGVHIGNHEARILKETSINLTKIICKSLKISYLGFACWNLVYVGNQNYTIYSLHGSTGSKFVYTKLKALIDISHNFMADIIAMGHTHDVVDESTYVQKVDKKRKMVIEQKKYHIITGHYLRYDRSYAQEKGYAIGKMGSPKIKLFSEKHDIHIST
jgi:UDP-2,3-diacylglucosamine pyrophosphatase LpxH